MSDRDWIFILCVIDLALVAVIVGMAWRNRCLKRDCRCRRCDTEVVYFRIEDEQIEPERIEYPGEFVRVESSTESPVRVEPAANTKVDTGAMS